MGKTSQFIIYYLNEEYWKFKIDIYSRILHDISNYNDVINLKTEQLTVRSDFWQSENK